jgi:hypothetical protein
MIGRETLIAPDAAKVYQGTTLFLKRRDRHPILEWNSDAANRAQLQ